MTSAPTEIRSATSSADLDCVRTLLREYTAHLSSLIPHSYLEHRASELERLPGSFAPPDGALLLATMSGSPVGCAALRSVSLPDQSSAAEFCRLWVTPAARGHALGWQLLQASIDLARASGRRSLVLNSAADTMAFAQSLYRRAGFVPTPPYKLVSIPNIQFFRLDLTS